MRHILAAFFLLLGLSIANAMGPTREELLQQGFEPLLCTFTERCPLGQKCHRVNLNIIFWHNDAENRAFRDGGVSMDEAIVMRDQDRPRSIARSFLIPLRQGAAAHLTHFYSGGAIYSIQYEGSPASGQFLRGDCSKSTLPIS
ncbi:hypothetical protein [Pseudaestuariivita rosea]|uniref:hypothetical protein n=1 Tax=Pseudaestuariivita rosea TaxID=2763263 RepID=UPI001ABBA6CC|nr:hypothetical protein [Pseudaestuariivita rosea]